LLVILEIVEHSALILQPCFKKPHSRQLDNKNIEAHSLKIQGGGELKFLPKLAKIPWGGQGFQEKSARRSLISGFIALLLTRFFLIYWMGSFVYTPFPPSPHPTPECIYEQECFQLQNNVTY
jgi:hypothetical protein